jgi:hypothetical protein
LIAGGVGFGTLVFEASAHDWLWRRWWFWLSLIAVGLGVALLVGAAIHWVVERVKGRGKKDASTDAESSRSVGYRQSGGTADHEDLQITGYPVGYDHQGGHVKTRRGRIRRGRGEEEPKEEGHPIHPSEDS